MNRLEGVILFRRDCSFSLREVLLGLSVHSASGKILMYFDPAAKENEHEDNRNKRIRHSRSHNQRGR